MTGLVRCRAWNVNLKRETALWLGPTSDTVNLHTVLQPSSPLCSAPLLPPPRGHAEVVTALTPPLSLLLQKLLGNSLLKLEGDDRLDINCTLPLTDQVPAWITFFLESSGSVVYAHTVNIFSLYFLNIECADFRNVAFSSFRKNSSRSKVEWSLFMKGHRADARDSLPRFPTCCSSLKFLHVHQNNYGYVNDCVFLLCCR